MADQLHAGKKIKPGYGHGEGLWHSKTLRDGTVVYWRGDWGDRTPLELYLECATTMTDLLTNHPELLAKLMSLVTPPPTTACG